MGLMGNAKKTLSPICLICPIGPIGLISYLLSPISSLLTKKANG